MVKTFLFCDTMKRISVTIFIFGFIGICRSQKCSSPNITNHQIDVGYDFEKELSLTYSGVIRSFQMIGTVRIVGTSNNNFEMKYIDASYNSATGSLDLYTTENFPKYIEEQTSVIIYITVKLRCQDSSEPSLLFRLNLEQANLYDPKFPEDLYSFTVPLPLYKGFDLTTFQDIFARDIDLTGNAVTFTSSDSGIINVVTSSRIGSDQKTFYASLILTAPLLRITDALNLTITATDSGTPPRQSIARVSISGNETVTLPPQPRFENIVYEGKLDEKYSLSIENAVLVAETWSNAVKFTTEGQDRSFFTTTVLNNAVIIRLARPIREQDIKDKSFLSFTIVASKPDVPDGRCAVVVSIPQKSSGHHFSKSLYVGSLDSLGNLTIEDITYDPNDYTPDILFYIDGPDRNLFDISNNQNQISIGFSSDTEGSDFRNRQFLFAIIIAVREQIAISSTGISISLPIVPRFDQSNYAGRIDKDGTLYLENIYLESKNLGIIRSISIRGQNAARFEPKRTNNEIRLELRTEFSDREIRSLKFISLTLIAISSSGVEGSSQILIDFPNFPDTPQFEQALYGGKINNQGNLELDEIVLINATYTDGTEFQLQGDASDHFALNTEKNIIKIRLVKSIPALILRAEDYLVLILVARNPDGDSGSTSILLDLPSLRGPEFSETLYKGSLDRYFKLSVGAISISPNTYEEGIEISLSGGDSQYFKVKLDKMDILLDTIDNFESGQLDGRSVLEFKILAKNKGGLAGSAFVVIEVSNICAQGTCPPCMAPTSEPCSEVTTPKPTGVPVFDRQFYSYRVDPGFIGVLSAVTAKIQDSNDGIRYSLEVTSAHLEPRLSIDQSTGQLTIHDSVSPGLYAFKLLATNSVTNSQGSAIARLTVDAVTICPNGTMVSSSLLIKPIAEEAIHTDLLYTRYGRCMLTVFSMEPNDKEYVQINSRTNQLFTIAIDREDKIFSDMLVPQIQVKLKLNCPGMDDTTERFRRSLSDGSSAFGDRSLVLTDDIPFNPYVTILSLVIEDINDNSPEFKNPPRSDFVIGYPEIEVLFDLMPEFLIQVAATDKDAGLNAQIRYGIIANDFFEIDPISGIVYPLAASKNRADDFELIVTACDRDGASDGRKAAIKIIVKTILSRHLSLLTVENQNIQDLDNLLSSISMRTKMDIYNLRHAMMPDRKVQNKDGILNRSYTRFKNLLIRQSEHRMILKTWIYAIDEKNDFVDNTDVEKKLSEINDEFDLVTVPYYSERQSSEKFEKVDTSGLITGISLLGSIIILAIVGGLVYWWFWLRPYRFKTGLNETTSETISSESTMDHEIKYKNSSNIYYENDDDFVASQYKKRESMPISGTTHLETSDESNGSSYDSYNDSDNSRGQNERRKSMVTFNELVERIDIEIGHNNFRRNNDDDARL